MQYIIERHKLPKEINIFFDKVFELYEMRGKVGLKNGIIFQIRTNEQNHSRPHVHASYGEYSISIDIVSGTILAGKLPQKNQKIAVAWVLEHKEKLMNDWRNIAICATSTMTCSKLNLTD